MTTREQKRTKLRDSTLSDEVECAGDWWLPNDPDQAVSGTLSFNRSAWAVLELDGVLLNSDGALVRSTNTIHGVTRTGESLTLHGVQDAGVSVSVPGTRRAKFYADDAFVGAWIDDPDQCVFDRSGVTFEHLEEWLKWSPIDFSGDEDKAEVTFEKPLELEVWVPAIDAAVVARVRHRVGTSGRRGYLSFEPCLELRPRTPEPLSWHRKTQSDLARLLFVLCGEELHRQRFRLEIGADDSSERREVHSLAENRGEVDGSWRHPHRFLFSAPEVLQHSPEFLPSWFEATEELAPVLNMFLGPLSQTSMFVEFQFLSSMQALEGYHRRFEEAAYATPVEYEPWRQALVKAIPPEVPRDMAKSLEASFKFGYEYSQRKRLKTLFKSLEVETAAAIEGGISDFVNKVVTARNTLVHNLPSTNEALTLKELHTASERLRSWMLILLLKHIGLPEELALARIRRHPRWRRRVSPAKAPAEE